jgi:transcriptional regulator with XRE-family HTH domain
MTGQDLREARRRRGWTQGQAAEHLGLSQAYVSMLERDRRPLPAHLVKDVLCEYELAPLALPLRGPKAWAEVDNNVLAKQLAGLGYPGFSYMKARATWNPAELLVAALNKDDLEPRVAEALPWLVLRYRDADWDWVVRETKLRDQQNRLGFVMTLAREVAQRKGDAVTADKLLYLEHQLERSKLANVGTFCRESMSEIEKRWLREKTSTEARRWNLLSDLAPEHLEHAGSYTG